jgi:hypothetical protein
MPGPRQTSLGYYQDNYLKALRDPKYAAAERVRAEALVKESASEVSELTKKYEKAVAEAKRQDNIIKEKAAQNEANPSAQLDAQIKNAQIAQRNALNSSALLFNQVNFATALQSSRTSYLYKLSGVTATPVRTLASGGGSGGGNKAETTNPSDYKYKYNAPMVKWAYFNAAAGVPISIDFIKSKSNTPTKISNARESFNLPATRGAIQLSPEVAQQLRKRGKSKDKTLRKKDNTNYGFRFHYNPTGVGMSYGMMMDMSAELLTGGRENLNMVTPLQRGGWSIDLYLNRMEDLSYIKPDGSLVSDLSSLQVYPETVDASELKKIYNKGTMYDIEYLFRTINGGDSDYNSELRGETSDIGWIAGIAVEFHMGNGLRYLGQITSIDINHAVFNDRMVPMLSTVTIKASRFYDLPILKGKRS